MCILYSGNAELSEDPISAGIPSYVTQEEFNRFSGFWWQPVSVPDGMYDFSSQVIFHLFLI